MSDGFEFLEISPYEHESPYGERAGMKTYKVLYKVDGIKFFHFVLIADDAPPDIVNSYGLSVAKKAAAPLLRFSTTPGDIFPKA